MSQNEQDLQLDLRLMAYLDRQLPAAEAARLEADLAKDAALAARFTAMKASLAGLDGLMHQFSATIEAKTPPDWSSSLAGSIEKMAQLDKADAVANLPAPAGLDAPEILAATPRSAAARAKVIPVPQNRWMHSLAAAAALVAAVLLMVFVMQEVPFLPLVPQAARPDSFQLPENLDVTVDPTVARPIQATPAAITAEQLVALGLSEQQAEQFLHDGVLMLSHGELPAWKSAGLEAALTVGSQRLPTYLTADAVYNLFLLHMTDASEAFDKAENAKWGALCVSSRDALVALRHPNHPTHAGPGPEALFEYGGDGLAAILDTAAHLAQQDFIGNANTAAEDELQRVRKAPDQTYSELLGHTVNYAWIRQHPASMARRWLSFVTTSADHETDAKRLTHSLKLWWIVLQKDPTLWAQYCTLAGHTRYEEAGTATALDLVDLHDDFVKICGDDPKQAFDRLMRADLSTYKKPLGFLPPRTPFRDELAAAVGASHSYLDGVIANPAVDRTPFVGLRQRATAVDAFLQTQGSDSALARWNRLFSTVAKPADAWPSQTAAFQEKSNRLIAAAWVGTPVRPQQIPVATNNESGVPFYTAFEAAPDFYHRLAAVTRERASTLAKEDPHQARLAALAAWLEELAKASLQQWAGKPVTGATLPPAPELSSPLQPAPESICRVAQEVDSAEAGKVDILMGNGALAAILVLQRDTTGATRVYVGAVSNPREGLAPHSADPQAAWSTLAADGVLAGFHYNGR